MTVTTPPELITDRTGVFPPRLFASVGYYALMSRYSNVFVDNQVRYNKRDKEVHRYRISHTGGCIDLTVPVSREPGSFLSGNLTWERVTVSPHGRWWEVHLTALDSAYGRTPFYEYYRDRLVPLFVPRPLSDLETITDLVKQANRIILPIVASRTTLSETMPDGEMVEDFRRSDFHLTSQPPYYQIHAERSGFNPNLSILDLIFNLGPESAIYLASL